MVKTFEQFTEGQLKNESKRFVKDVEELLDDVVDLALDESGEYVTFESKVVRGVRLGSGMEYRLEDPETGEHKGTFTILYAVHDNEPLYSFGRGAHQKLPSDREFIAKFIQQNKMLDLDIRTQEDLASMIYRHIFQVAVDEGLDI